MLAQAVVSTRQPEIVEMPSQKMAVVYTRGEPSEALSRIMPALFGAVYSLKFDLRKQGRDFKVGVLRVRWPDIFLLPREQWVGICGLPVPEDTTELEQKVRSVPVSVETWEYGTVAQILHVGPYSTEEASIKVLQDFITENGYAITGAHEEEYLTTPKAKVQKTIIRYPVRKRVPAGA